MDGLTVLQQLRRSSRELPVIVVSARVDTTPVGADGHLAKPFWFSELLAVVQRHTNESSTEGPGGLPSTEA